MVRASVSPNGIHKSRIATYYLAYLVALVMYFVVAVPRGSGSWAVVVVLSLLGALLAGFVVHRGARALRQELNWVAQLDFYLQGYWQLLGASGAKRARLGMGLQAQLTFATLLPLGLQSALLAFDPAIEDLKVVDEVNLSFTRPQLIPPLTPTNAELKQWLHALLNDVLTRYPPTQVNLLPLG